MSLTRHERLKLIIADDLLWYTRTAIRRGNEVVLDVPAVQNRCERRYDDMLIFLRRTIQHLEKGWISRVVVRRYRECITPEYVAIHRVLLIAYHTIGPFTACVRAAAAGHSVGARAPVPGAEALNALFLLDEMAMCISLGEYGSDRYEYSPYE